MLIQLSKANKTKFQGEKKIHKSFLISSLLIRMKIEPQKKKNFTQAHRFDEQNMKKEKKIL